MRSQMAEGFLRFHARERFEVASAGTHPMGQVIPDVIEVMAEKGVDIRHHTSDAIDPALVERSLHIIDLGGRGRERIPAAYRARYEHWRIQDPYGMGMAGLREIRDLIEARVVEFVKTWSAAKTP